MSDVVKGFGVAALVMLAGLAAAEPSHGADLLTLDDASAREHATQAIVSWGNTCKGGAIVQIDMDNGDWWLTCPLDYSGKVYVWDHVGDFWEYAGYADAYASRL